MIKIYSILVRHPINYKQLLDDQRKLMYDFHSHPKEFVIETVIELSKEEFTELKNNLSQKHEFIGKQNSIFLVKEKGKLNNEGLIIDPDGSSYAQHVGIPMERLDINKCPHCGKYYAEAPAISRTDNKLKICSECGQKEALELFAEYKKSQEFKKFIETSQITANIYNAKIVISVSGEDDIVIEPTKKL